MRPATAARPGDDEVGYRDSAGADGKAGSLQQPRRSRADGEASYSSRADGEAGYTD